MNAPNFDAFLHALNRINPLAPEAWNGLRALIQARDVPSGHHLLRPGSLARNCIFIQSGLLREYYVDRDGKEATRRFCGPGELSGSLADLLSQAPAAVAIETLQACQILELDWSAVNALSLLHPSLMLLMRRFAEGLYVQKMQREFEMLTLSAAERYARFAQSQSALEAQLPRHMVASYLGITPVHLSRIAGAERSPRATTVRPGKT